MLSTFTMFTRSLWKNKRAAKKKGPSPKHFSNKAKKTAFPILAYVVCVCGQDRLKDKRRPRKRDWNICLFLEGCCEKGTLAVRDLRLCLWIVDLFSLRESARGHVWFYHHWACEGFYWTQQNRVTNLILDMFIWIQSISILLVLHRKTDFEESI